MTDARSSYDRVKPVGKAPHAPPTGYNDNEGPSRDATVSLAVPDRRMATGSVARARPAAATRNSDRLRDLAGWYRDFAERAGSPNIWERRVHTAEDLEAEASRIERISR